MSRLAELARTQLVPWFTMAGRVKRNTYAKFCFFVICANIIVALIMNESDLISMVLTLAYLLLLVPLVWVGICMHVKRLHDLDKTGWLVLVLLIPPFNFILFLYLLLTRGSPVTNRYGPPDELLPAIEEGKL